MPGVRGVLDQRPAAADDPAAGDLPYGQTPLRVRWHKVQYACRETGCARKAFTEQIAELPAGPG